MSACSDVVSLSDQASLNSSMDSLKAELNTALQYDREAEDEVKKLKVRENASKTRFGRIYSRVLKSETTSLST